MPHLSEAKKRSMEATPLIRDGKTDDLETLVETLSDSFSQDPLFNWVFPQTELYPAYFRLLVRDVYLPRGIVHTDSDGRAAALWLPPEERFEIPPRLGLLGFGFQLFMREGLRPLWRLRQQSGIYTKHLPREPHYYLQFLGCRSSEQGQGIGTALIKKGTQICDERGIPAFLESSNILNVPLYERHGFEIRAEEALATGGPTVWFMWREPQ
ncbi:MAG: GNAT superfamily N-acetyltransferase [Bacteroidia bacterium]|jgi:GNAT superfamily N-acetyltransferase